jgi:hypothetical protein
MAKKWKAIAWLWLGDFAFMKNWDSAIYAVTFNSRCTGGGVLIRYLAQL